MCDRHRPNNEPVVSQLDIKCSFVTNSFVKVLATGFNIEENLKRLAEYRSDVFGKGDDEVVIGKRVGEYNNNADNNSVIREAQASSAADRGAKRGLADEQPQQRAIADEDRGKMGHTHALHMLQQSLQPPMPGTNQRILMHPSLLVT